jgi:hypothetical protein
MLVRPTARPSHIISHSATRKLSLRHSSTLYDAHEPRLRLGRGRLGECSGRLRQCKLLGEEAKRPGMNSQARPRDGSHDNASRLNFKAPWRTMTNDGTCQLPSTVSLFYFSLVPLPL